MRIAHMQCKVDTNIDREREGSVDLSVGDKCGFAWWPLPRKSTCLRHTFATFRPPPPYEYSTRREWVPRLISLGIRRVGVRHPRVRSLGYRDDKLDLSCVVGVEAEFKRILVYILMICIDEYFDASEKY